MSNGQGMSKGGNSNGASPMGNGYGALNSFKRNNGVQGKGPQSAGQTNGQNGNNVKDSVEAAKTKAKKQATKKALTTAAKAYNPALGKAVEKGLETKKGDEYLDEFAKGETPNKGIRNVARKFKKETRKKTLILSCLSLVGPVLLLIILGVLFFKNDDSQVYSNDNDGEISEIKENDTKLSNEFLMYPGLYEKIESRIDDIATKYGVEVDKYLIIATLIAPIENGTIVPENNAKCGKDDRGDYNLCYKYDDKYYNWEEFLQIWGNQAGLLAKMQIITDVNIPSTKNYGDACKYSNNTMETYAKNDKNIAGVSIWDRLNPKNWFTDNLEPWKRAEDAEVNARCNDAKKGKSQIPDVYSLSNERGYYVVTPKEDGTFEYDYDPNSGGVYYWNLVNQGGFLQTYLKDYIGYDPNLSESQNYERTRPFIIETANYIYRYYESIRRDCRGVDVMYSTIEKIRVHNVNGDDISYYGEYMDVDLEVYVGCVIMAEYNTSNVAASEAFAILARTEGVAIVGLDGSGVIENSSNDQNCDLHAYNPTYDPSYKNQDDNPNYDPDYPKTHNEAAYKAVQNTKGIVVSEFSNPAYKPRDAVIKHTMYDAFCPTKRIPENGMYYLPDGQRKLPVEDGVVYIPQEYLDCPCFQNKNSRPGDAGLKFATSPTVPPTEPDGNPRQETLAKCWTPTGATRVNDDNETEYQWFYKPSGGHGEGVSQIASGYFALYGYSRYSLIKLFYDRENEYDGYDYHIGYKRLESMIDEGMCSNRLILGVPEKDESGED